MDFGLAFSYVFQDKDWLRKVGIVALISLIPILGQLVLIGWSLNITKRVIDRHPEPLPEVDFGSDLGRGFSAFVIGFVYSLPITLFALVFAILDSATYQSSSDAVFTMVTIVSLCFSLFAFVYGIAMAIVLPAAYGNYVAKGNLGAGFALGEVFGLVRANIGAYLIVLLGSFVSGLIAPLGTILCIVGVVLTYTYTVAVMGHFYGQAYNAATQNRAAAVAG
ncbi:MAG: DUF4013 domain-containing protein [Chloroflexota bacterium]